MPGSYDGEGVKTDNFVEIPDGEYTLRITDAEQGVTRNGDDKVTVSYEIVGGPYHLQPIKYHTVVFFKDKNTKGAGMAIKFLKSIGEPHEGQFAWNEKNWIGKKLKAMIMQEVQTMGKSTGKKFPRIQWVNPPDEGNIPVEELPF
jgi:hypothetical protein